MSTIPPIVPATKPKISYSKWKRMKECYRKYYEQHLRPEELDVHYPPVDTHRAFIGSVTQHIMEMVINKRLYQTMGFAEICNQIDQDLKCLKPLMSDTDDLEEAIDGQALCLIEGAVILEKVQECGIDIGENYNIYVAMNSIIKKIRLTYKTGLQFLLTHPDIDKCHSEVELSVESEFFYHKGTVDFIFEFPEYLIIWDGKKGASSHLDDDQLAHYKLMAEIKYGKPVKELAWLIWDNGKRDKDEDKDYVLEPIDHEGSTEALLSAMVEKHTFIADQGWSEPDDFPMKKDYMSCMFCDWQPNCLAHNNSKEELTEI